jgi:hypothetical protein
MLASTPADNFREAINARSNGARTRREQSASREEQGKHSLLEHEWRKSPIDHRND